MHVGDNMTLEEIVDQYKNYKTSIEIDNFKDFYSHLRSYQEELKESIKTYKKELKENKQMHLEAKIRNFFFFIFQEEETSFYYYDDAIIKEIIKEMKLQYENISDIMLLANESNYKDLLKLVEFLMMHYDNNIDFLENERKNLELSLENVIYYNPLQDTRKIINQFIQKIIQTYYDELIKVEKIYKL